MLARRFCQSICLTLFALVCTIASGTEPWETISTQLRSRPLLRSAAADDSASSRFIKLEPTSTGVDFVAGLDWEHPQGLLFFTGFASGGVAVGDVDGNGLPDLFFAGGPNRDRLYLQRAPWKFVENASAAGLRVDEHRPPSKKPWSTGATLLDIDNDGDLDLYVCHYDAANRLYINRGDGTFDERGSAYGLDIVDACLMASVADYDRDGDLDIYLSMNRYLDEKEFRRQDLFYWRDGMEYLRPAAEKCFTIRRQFDKPGQLNMWAGRTDRLLRNEGPNQKFSDTSAEMGLSRGDTLSATWWDYNHDGWPDLYVANDLAAPDRLFQNHGDGSFEDVALRSLPHVPWQAMGSCAGDINNDGLVDFLAADMSFRTHFKDKLFMGDMSAKYRNISVFPHDQLMRNSLFVNTGTEHFQEAAYLAGIASTDWTWSAKLADLDNDGRLDAFFTNGSPVNLSSSAGLETPSATAEVIDTGDLRARYKKLPPVLEQNLVYQNQGELRFVDQSQAWGLDHTGMSFGAVHADMDRDGDLDLIVANLDQPPSLYRNESRDSGVLVELRGSVSNRFGVGAEVIVETAAGQQIQQVYPVAGFQSCQEAAIHFGLGAANKITKLTVRWPSGVEQVFADLAIARQYQVREVDAAVDKPTPHLTPKPAAHPKPVPWFVPLEDAILAEHHDEPFDDFERQPLLPNKLSQLGPPMAWGDIDADGDEDLFLGEGSHWMGMIYLNQGDATFLPRPQVALARDEACEDSAAVFFDANNDTHLDLYVGSGSVECSPDDELLRDRLYLGDGKGNFKNASEQWLPALQISTGAVAAHDFDHDGDVDVFVGGRSIPGEYPMAPEHALLRNEGDHFANVLGEIAPKLSMAGMVTAAVWVDVDGDGWQDLLLATDWGPIRLYLNRKGQLFEATQTTGLSKWTGWWQSLACADVDQDGDQDFVAGNFGLNTKYKATATKPVLVYYGEYGGTGQRNLIEASFEGNTLFPLRGKSCSSAAMPHLAKQFSTYEQFAKATLSEIYSTDCLEEAKKFEVNTLVSACFINDGNGHFELVALPVAAQLSPVFALAVTEVNGDGVPDLYLGQNFFGPQSETGPMDGGLGVVALGRGDGTFLAVRPDEAGITVSQDTKAVAAIDFDGDGQRDLCVATNNGPVRLFLNRASGPRQPRDANLQATPNWTRRNLAFARQFFASGQVEQSLPYLRRALKASPRNTQATLLLASVLGEQEHFTEAEALLQRLELEGSTDTESLLAMRGRIAFKMQHYDRAAQYLTEAATIKPQDRRIQHYLGDVRHAQCRLGDARRHYEQAGLTDRVAEVDQAAKVAKLLYEQGSSAQLAGDDEAAFRLLEKSRRLDSKPETLEALAVLLRNTSDEQLRDEWYAEQLLRWRDEAKQEQAVPTK